MWATLESWHEAVINPALKGLSGVKKRPPQREAAFGYQQMSRGLGRSWKLPDRDFYQAKSSEL